MSRPIRVVVADDSQFVRELIASYLDSSDDMQVVAVAEDGQRAVELVSELRPDVVTLDVDMPRLSGLEALTAIMSQAPTPAVMVSGVSTQAAVTTYAAMQRGAVDFILKYIPGTTIDPAEMRLDVISKVRAASRVKVVRAISSRLPEALRGTATQGRVTIAATASATPRGPSTEPGTKQIISRRISPTVGVPQSAFNRETTRGPRIGSTGADTGIVVIGASTGGPIAIRELIGRLPVDFPAPILVVQHVPAAFTNVLVSQLAKDSPFPTTIAERGQSLRGSTVYIAPGDHHLLMASDQTIGLFDGPTISGHRPSIDITMKSLAQCSLQRVYGVLLTGMGEDGAAGLAYIKARGGATFVQSTETCVVAGMPQRALELGAADFIGSPVEIADRIAVDVLQRTLTRQYSASHTF